MFKILIKIYVNRKHACTYCSVQYQSPFVHRTFIVFLKAQSSRLQYILLFSTFFLSYLRMFIGRVFYAYLTE